MLRSGSAAGEGQLARQLRPVVGAGGRGQVVAAVAPLQDRRIAQLGHHAQVVVVEVVAACRGGAMGGVAEVEEVDAGGAVLDGFSRQRCVPLRGNELDWRVAWKTADLAAVREAVKIRFILTRSRLYSYRWS